MKNTLIIMGSHPKTRDEFDWSREDVDILVFNEAMKMPWVKRADYVIQIHLPVIWRNPGNRNDPKHYDWLKSGNTPTVLMQDKYDDVPKSVRYPLDEVEKLGHRYLTSSAAYAIAWGIVSGYERIEIYGVEMETNTEYAHQRPGVAYWIGLAKGTGVDVDYHGELLSSPLYGYEGDIKFAYTYFDERIKELQIAADTAHNQYNNNCTQSNQLMAKYINTGTNPQEVIKLLQQQVELAALFGVQDGARQEVIRYKNKADANIKATGDYLFSRQEFEHAASSFTKNRDASIITATRLAEECQRYFDHVKETSNTEKRRKRMDTFIKLVQNYVTESIKVGMYDGASKENREFMKLLDNLGLMAGGANSVEVLQAEYREREAVL